MGEIIQPAPRAEFIELTKAVRSLIEAFPDGTDHTSIAVAVADSFSGACVIAGYNSIDQIEARAMLNDVLSSRG